MSSKTLFVMVAIVFLFLVIGIALMASHDITLPFPFPPSEGLSILAPNMDENDSNRSISTISNPPANAIPENDFNAPVADTTLHVLVESLGEETYQVSNENDFSYTSIRIVVHGEFVCQFPTTLAARSFAQFRASECSNGKEYAKSYAVYPIEISTGQGVFTLEGFA